MALATFLCIISPMCLMLLAALSGRPGAAITEGAAAAIGLCVLLLLVAGAVAIFLSCGARTKPFEYMVTIHQDFSGNAERTDVTDLGI